jgi:hypothetical protein
MRKSSSILLGCLATVGLISALHAGEVKSDNIYSPYVVGENATQVYWGDTHLHTSYSADAGMIGNTLGPEVAYRFALGHEIKTNSGQKARLIRPSIFWSFRIMRKTLVCHL